MAKGRVSRRSKSRDKVSLLANPSPPPSPSPYGPLGGVSTVSSNRAPTADGNNPANSITTTTNALDEDNSTLSLEGDNSIPSQLPQQNRFLPQHIPKEDTRQVQSASMALQFVPAYEESTTPAVERSATSNSQNDLPLPPASDNHSASWDAIIETDDSNIGGSRRFLDSRSSQQLNNPLDVSRQGSASAQQHSSVRAAAPRTKEYRSAVDDSPPAVSAPVVNPPSQRRGPRMARLAKIFSNRNAGSSNQETKQLEPRDALSRTSSPPAQPPRPIRKSLPGKSSEVVPPSPSRSSVSGASSGYVGWPGTQDKRGGTVTIQSSYDDSSVGAAAFRQRRKHANLDDSDVEMNKWMESSFDEKSSTGATNKLDPREHGVGKPEMYRSRAQVGDDESEDEEENPADFHLKALVASSTATSPLAGGGPSHARPPNGFSGLRDSQRLRRSVYSGPDRAGRSMASSSRAGARSVAETSASDAISIKNLFGNENTNRASSAVTTPIFHGDPWDTDSSPYPPSSPATSISKNSSAYFDVRDSTGMSLPSLDGKRQPYPYDMKPNLRANASAIMRQASRERPRPEKEQRSREPQPPTEAALAAKDRTSSNPRMGSTENFRGYRGFYDKTKEMPNLIDALDSDSVASSRATSTFSTNLAPSTRAATRKPDRIDEDSDVFDMDSDIFDGLSAIPQENSVQASDTQVPTVDEKGPYEKLNDSAGEGVANLNLVMLGGGLTAIQTTPDAYEKRRTATDFDEDLTNSDVGQYGFTRIPGFNKIASAGRREPGLPSSEPQQREQSPLDRLPLNIRARIPASRRTNGTQRSVLDTSLAAGSDSGSSNVSDDLQEELSYYAEDLYEYRIPPQQTRKLVKRYRELCPTDLDYMTEGEYQREEDSKKAFALHEMRSRIMEKDIERGLERQGGTVAVDDIVTTPYHQAAQRVRDAVLVSKAWRDGASPRDVITAALLTRREERTYCVKRPVAYRTSPGRSPGSIGSSSTVGTQWISYTLEPVTWVDDVDFMQLRCPSLGPRCMRGFELFTIGDCQSILLKLTNEHCLSLRSELNEATARQIEAEESMKEEGDASDGMMTEAEMTFLASMEEVKTISKKLVVAEKSFNLVRDRIEKLVSRYEALLVKIETESVYAPSSIATYESSYYSDGTSEDDREKEQLARRAQRAELRAELAAREAMLAKQEAEKIRNEKQLELDALQQQLNELQSESSLAMAEREHSTILARAITATEGDTRSVHDPSKPKINQEKVDSVKKKFRDRVAARTAVRRGSSVSSRRSESGSSFAPSRTYSAATTSFSGRVAPRASERPPLARKSKYGLTGEEMFQHLDFYERSLKAVANARNTLKKHEQLDSSI